MPTIAPFDGLLYDPARVGDLAAATAPPYDVILPHDLARFHRASRHNIARVDLGVDEGPHEKYTHAGEILRRWRDEGALVPVGKPAIYPYEMRFAYRAMEHRVRGLIVEVGLEPWGRQIVPHERTMAGPVEDRLAHLRATAANLSAIYAVCAGPSEAQAALLDRAQSRPPDRELTDEEGVRHRLWVEMDASGSDTDALVGWYRQQALLIADGHHRYQTALAHREEMRSARGPGPWDGVMMLLVDSASENPPVLPIHRVVAVDPIPEIPGDRVRDLGEVLAWLADDDLRFAAVIRRNGELVHLVGRLEGEPPTVSALHRTLLDPMPGVRDLGFVQDPALAEEMVHTGRFDLAFFLPPARVEYVRAVVEQGGQLPQKSTYFWPKPRTGMVIRPLA
ncbi:MAG TPA: DUF1015 domain-containing protein [Actinomycetota bacterium]|nr:DUF1015 domain-containing protein [Actinomycetota bacterium]